ncbi:tetratricopeptide repeat protein, partial [Kitasatospora sp. NPDC051170]|uniref:tetratricopeptide repeat protein n=1 Tax=Kitasatospora sp. NPDC051170 TaxID=3364056 RepID=UPI003788A993
LANHLSGVGRREEAVAPAEEAVRLRRGLAQTNSAAYLPDLAAALSNVANHLSGVGRREEAVAPAEEAADIYRGLAQANSAAYLPDLAGALNNLAIRLSGVGRREEALAPAEEAADIYRGLAQANSAAYLPDLASALSNLANHLSEAGRCQEALQHFEEIIAEWSGPSQAAAELAYHRALFLLRHGEMVGGIEALCGLLTPATPIDGSTVFRIHQRLREAVESDPALHEIVTRRCADRGAASESPSWLEVTDTALQLTADWTITRTWAESRDFVTTHPSLLDAASRTALREWSLLGGPAAFHIELLDQLLSGIPVNAAYRPLVLPEILTAWIRTSADGGGWAASAAYLAEHEDDLLAPDTDAALATMGEGPEGESQVVAVHRAILAMAGSDGIDAAYGLLENRQALHVRLQSALETANGTELARLALIEDGVYDAPWPAAVHWLAAQALDDTPATSGSDADNDGSGPGVPIAAVHAATQADGHTAAHVLSAAAGEREPDVAERNRAVAELAALMATVPTRAAALGELLQAVLAPAVQAPEE